jgi:hypothetical protein
MHTQTQIAVFLKVAGNSKDAQTSLKIFHDRLKACGRLTVNFDVRLRILKTLIGG